jgi:two-component system sensor histidine kinase AlgZ
VGRRRAAPFELGDGDVGCSVEQSVAERIARCTKMFAVANQRQLIRDTLRALCRPRRVVPIALICVPIVLLVAIYPGDPWGAPLALLMSLVYPTLAPTAWRLLFSRSRSPSLSRSIAFGLVGLASVGVLGALVPWALQMDWTLLTDGPALVAEVLVFWVGGWSLGRDIELEGDLNRALARNREIAREAEHARLLALQRHLDPHFLFNTLNAIAEWCTQDPTVAEQATLQLSRMLRTVLEGVKQPTWPLARELALVADLVALYRARDADRLTFESDVSPDCLEVAVPPLALLLVTENAIKHGPWAGHPGAIRLDARREGPDVTLVLSNPGPFRGPRPGSDGLPTLRRRLALLYDGAAELTIQGAGERTQVRMRLPIRQEKPA